jgi:hypothetical protein
MGTGGRTNLGAGAQLKIAAATSSKMSPQSHQNFSGETRASRNIPPWSTMTTRHDNRNNIRHTPRNTNRETIDIPASDFCK